MGTGLAGRRRPQVVVFTEGWVFPEGGVFPEGWVFPEEGVFPEGYVTSKLDLRTWDYLWRSDL